VATTWLSLLVQAITTPLSADFWRRLLSGLKEVWRALVACLRRIKHGEWPPPRRPSRQGCCIDLPNDVYKRADPLIYAQYYLMAQGLAVTWDNPDIDIFDGAVLVTGPLLPNHTYRVRVRVWNGSYDAPAVGVAVDLSYLSFGVQTVSNPIDKRSVNLGAKGTIDHPAFALFDWTTPPVGGHYCLQARLFWDDDANPENNLGQKNVNVTAALSPAIYSFVVRNAASVPLRFFCEADAYVLHEPPPCREQGERPKTRLQESRERWDIAKREQGYGHSPLPADWSVTIAPREFGLDPRDEQVVEVAIEPADPSFRGAKAFNVHVFTPDEHSGRRLVGGVTLVATKA
jgi:hypothetical protein